MFLEASPPEPRAVRFRFSQSKRREATRAIVRTRPEPSDSDQMFGVTADSRRCPITAHLHISGQSSACSAADSAYLMIKERRMET